MPNDHQIRWNTLIGLSKAEKRLWNHMVDFNFLYHKTDDKGKFSPRVVRSMIDKGVIQLDNLEAKEPFYEFTDLYRSEAKSIGMID